MKFLTTFTAIIFCLCVNSQIEINGTWAGNISYPPLASNDSLSITFTIKVDSIKNKITGSSMSRYNNGVYVEKTFLGKLYKKKDGFYVEEDDLGKKSFSGHAPLIFLDRYDFDFNESTTSELSGKVTCIRSSFSTTLRCHENTTVKLIRTQ